MNTVFASGVNAFQAATVRLDAAAGVVNRVRSSTIPAALSQSALAPNAPAGQTDAPPPPAGPGGRVPSSYDGDFIDAQVGMIRAEHEAAAAASLVKTADDMMGVLLDIAA